MQDRYARAAARDAKARPLLTDSTVSLPTLLPPRPPLPGDFCLSCSFVFSSILMRLFSTSPSRNRRLAGFRSTPLFSAKAVPFAPRRAADLSAPLRLRSPPLELGGLRRPPPLQAFPRGALHRAASQPALPGAPVRRISAICRATRRASHDAESSSEDEDDSTGALNGGLFIPLSSARGNGQRGLGAARAIATTAGTRGESVGRWRPQAWVADRIWIALAAIRRRLRGAWQAAALRAAYEVERRIMLGSVRAKLAAYFAAGVPFVLVATVAYRLANPDASLGHSLAQSFGNLYHVPGPLVLGDATPSASAVNAVVYFVGTLTFALVLGSIGGEVAERLAWARRARAPVPASGHALVLGWSEPLAPALLRALAARAKRARATTVPVVLVAPQECDVLEAKLAASGISTGSGGSGEVVVPRSGSPSDPDMLRDAGIARAKVVIVLPPSDLAGAGDGEGGAAAATGGWGGFGAPIDLSSDPQRLQLQCSHPLITLSTRRDRLAADRAASAQAAAALAARAALRHGDGPPSVLSSHACVVLAARCSSGPRPSALRALYALAQAEPRPGPRLVFADASAGIALGRAAAAAALEPGSAAVLAALLGANPRRGRAPLLRLAPVPRDAFWAREMDTSEDHEVTKTGQNGQASATSTENVESGTRNGRSTVRSENIASENSDCIPTALRPARRRLRSLPYHRVRLQNQANAVVIGFRDRRGRVSINPREDDRVPRGASVVLLDVGGMEDDESGKGGGGSAGGGERGASEKTGRGESRAASSPGPESASSPPVSPKPRAGPFKWRWPLPMAWPLPPRQRPPGADLPSIARGPSGAAEVGSARKGAKPTDGSRTKEGTTQGDTSEASTRIEARNGVEDVGKENASGTTSPLLLETPCSAVGETPPAQSASVSAPPPATPSSSSTAPPAVLPVSSSVSPSTSSAASTAPPQMEFRLQALPPAPPRTVYVLEPFSGQAAPAHDVSACKDQQLLPPPLDLTDPSRLALTAASVLPGLLLDAPPGSRVVLVTARSESALRALEDELRVVVQEARREVRRKKEGGNETKNARKRLDLAEPDACSAHDPARSVDLDGGTGDVRAQKATNGDLATRTSEQDELPQLSTASASAAKSSSSARPESLPSPTNDAFSPKSSPTVQPPESNAPSPPSTLSPSPMRSLEALDPYLAPVPPASPPSRHRARRMPSLDETSGSSLDHSMDHSEEEDDDDDDEFTSVWSRAKPWVSTSGAPAAKPPSGWGSLGTSTSPHLRSNWRTTPPPTRQTHSLPTSPFVSSSSSPLSRLWIVRADPDDPSSLASAGIAQADAVLMLPGPSPERVAESDACDAATLARLAALRAALLLGGEESRAWTSDSVIRGARAMGDGFGADLTVRDASRSSNDRDPKRRVGGEPRAGISPPVLPSFSCPSLPSSLAQSPGGGRGSFAFGARASGSARPRAPLPPTPPLPIPSSPPAPPLPPSSTLLTFSPRARGAPPVHVIACVWLQPTAKVAYDLLATSASQPGIRPDAGSDFRGDVLRTRSGSSSASSSTAPGSSSDTSGLSRDHARAVRIAQAAAASASAPPPLRLTAELLAPDEIFSGMLVQVATDPRLQDVIAAFATHVKDAADDLDGVRVALRQPGSYGIRTWGGTAFRTVAELARKRHETAIGFLMRDGELLLAPAADSERELCGGDRIIVLSS